MTTQGRDDLACHILRRGKGRGGHRLGLPGLAVVPRFLAVPDGGTEVNTVNGAHRQQGDLVIELHEALDDHFTAAGTAALLGVAP